MPEKIPVHFDFSGRPDNSGAKQTLFLLPAVATLLFLIFSGALKSFRFLTRQTSSSVRKEKTGLQLSTRLIRWFKVIIATAFIFIVIKTIRISEGTEEGLGIWFLPCLLAAISIPALVYLVKYYRNAK